MAQVSPWYWGFGWYWWLLAVLLLFIAGIVMARLVASRADARAGQSALETLRRRHLAGEISAEEYNTRKAIIERRERRR